MVTKYGAVCGIKIYIGNWRNRRKPVQLPLRPPQIHDLTWERIRAAAVGSWHLATSATARPHNTEKAQYDMFLLWICKYTADRYASLCTLPYTRKTICKVPDSRYSCFSLQMQMYFRVGQQNICNNFKYSRRWNPRSTAKFFMWMFVAEASSSDLPPTFTRAHFTQTEVKTKTERSNPVWSRPYKSFRSLRFFIYHRRYVHLWLIQSIIANRNPSLQSQSRIAQLQKYFPVIR
jgi:hypothetical protein